MAKQRQTDVNINYKVNVVDVEKGNQVLNRASQATDKLRADTQNFGNTAGKAFQQTSKYIEGMEIELAKLRQQIRLTNTQDTARLSQLSNQYKQLKQQVDAYNKSLFETSKASKSATSETQSFGTVFTDMYNTVKLFIAAGVARELVTISLNMAKLSGNVEGVEKAFARLPNSVLLLKELRESTQGTVSDFELMQKALSAQNFRIPLQNLGKLLEFATSKAQQTGQEVNHLVDYIVSGIGLRSIKRLDDLGFTANRVKEALGGVTLQAASMQQVMDAVTKLMDEDLKATGGLAETSATAVGQLTTAVHELNVEVARQGTNTKFIKFLTDAVDALRIYAKAGGSITNVPVVLFTEEVTKLATEQAAAFVESNKALKQQDQLLDVDKKLFELAQTIELYKEQNKWGLENVSVLKKEVEQLREKNKSFFGLQKLSGEEARLIDAKEKEIATILKSNEALGNNKAVLAEVIKLVIDYRKQLTTKVPIDTTDVEKDKRGLVVSDLRQIVDLDLKNPVTGEVGKYDKDNIIKAFNNLVNLLPAGSIPPLKQPVEITPMDDWDKIGLAFSERWRDIVASGLMDTTDLISATIQAEADGYDVRLAKLSAFYDEQILLAGDNERAKKELAIKRDREEQALRRKAFEADKEAKRLTTIINGAAGIINAFATLPYPAALVASLLIAGQTASQVAVINKQQYRGFAKGVIDLQGPGTGTSDSIPARLSKGESVMTAKETEESKGILKAVRAKTLNDKVLQEIASGRSGGSSVQVFNDSNIIKKLDEVKNAQPDIVQRGNLIYETRKKSDNYKQWIRSKSMNT